MSLIEEISNMENQGTSEEEVIVSLRERGVSPKDIMDAINQLKIKKAISNYESVEKDNNLSESDSSTEYDQEYTKQKEDNFSQTAYAQNMNPPQQETQPAYIQQGYSEQDYNSQGENYQPAGGGGIDATAIMEISEQVFYEKIKSIRKEMDSFNEFKSLSQIRIENLNERLKKMETVFDRLQLAILDKIGSYGQNLESIKKEMGMMQNSFSKIVEPLLDNAEKKQEEKKYNVSKKK